MCEPVSMGIMAASIAGSAGAATAAGVGLTSLAGVSMMAMGAGAGISAAGAYQQGKYQNEVARSNAQTQQAMANDAIARGEIAEQNHRRQVAQVQGDQRAAMGANNVDMTSGSMSGILQDTAQMGELEALTIRSNAQREAYGHNVAATNYRAEGNMAKTAGMYNAAGTLLSTAGSVGRDWYMYKGGTPDPYRDIWKRTTTRGATGPQR